MTNIKHMDFGKNLKTFLSSSGEQNFENSPLLKVFNKIKKYPKIYRKKCTYKN